MIPDEMWRPQECFHYRLMRASWSRLNVGDMGRVGGDAVVCVSCLCDDDNDDDDDDEQEEGVHVEDMMTL
jgi:hypothetical protein